MNSTTTATTRTDDEVIATLSAYKRPEMDTPFDHHSLSFDHVPVHLPSYTATPEQTRLEDKTYREFLTLHVPAARSIDCRVNNSSCATRRSYVRNADGTWMEVVTRVWASEEM